MAYLGNVPARSFISFERQVFTIVNSQTAYTLSHSVTNENDIRLVVNNVVQEPGSGKAYTASGTTLTLSAALVNGTDEMYCVFLGRAVGTVNAPAGSVSTSQLAGDAVTEAKIADGAVESEHLNNNVISGQTALASEPADTDEFLVSDAGVLKRIDYSLIKGGGKILQVASVNFAGDASTTSSSFQKAGTNFEVSLTPSSTNSKILVQMAGGNAYLNDDREMHIQMYRKIGSGSLSAMTANDVDGQSASIGYVMRATAFGGTMQLPHSFNYLDTPNTTSAVTYAPYFKSTTGNAVYFNTTDGVYWMIGLTAMEIEG